MEIDIVAQSRLAELAAQMFPPSKRAAVIADWTAAQQEAWQRPIVRDEDIARLEAGKRVMTPQRGVFKHYAVLYSIGVLPDSTVGPCWVVITALSPYKAVLPGGVVWHGASPQTINIAYDDKLREHLTEMSRFLLEGRGDGKLLVRKEKNRHYVGRVISAAERAIVPDLMLLASEGVKVWRA